MDGRTPERLEQVLCTEGVRAAVNPARFNVAGIIFTYQRTIACRHCLFACGPSCPHAVMSREDALACLSVYRDIPQCEICFEARHFLRRYYPEILTPEQIYTRSCAQ